MEILNFIHGKQLETIDLLSVGGTFIEIALNSVSIRLECILCTFKVLLQ